MFKSLRELFYDIFDSLDARIDETNEKLDLLTSHLKLEFKHIPSHIELVKKK